MAATIKLKRGTSAQWTALNPILAEGEIGLDLDLDKFKIGDGATAWNSLAFATNTPAEIATAVNNAASGTMSPLLLMGA